MKMWKLDDVDIVIHRVDMEVVIVEEDMETIIVKKGCGYCVIVREDVEIVIFGLAIHQNDHQARRRFVEWAQNEIAVVPDFHKRILFSYEAHFWLNGYVNKQNCRIWSEANPQVYVETPLHPEKLTLVRFMGWWNPSSKTMKATTLQSMVIGIEP
ncbi:uncharacterized protein TNCV_3186841 [Trichonephila clavipes]|nr:uncharacterized protein TNCV_3186841 [Trichonephila clavipes]